MFQANSNNEYQLTASIHTLAIKTDDSILLSKSNASVTDCIKSINTGTDGITKIILNPNKYTGEIYSWSEFKNVFKEILDKLDVKNLSIARCDMSLDSFNVDHYAAYAKLHRYLISLLTVAYKIDNTYRTWDLFSQQQVSVAVKNRYIEAENYDKRHESHGCDIARSRLELRSKYFKDTSIETEFLYNWPIRLEHAIDMTDACTEKYNYALADIYLNNFRKYPIQFRSLTDFLCHYNNCIFYSKQLEELFEILGFNNSCVKARHHKERYGLEYFTQADMRVVLMKITDAVRNFFAK